MDYRTLGNTGLFVSRLCLGAMTFGGRNTPPFDSVGGLDLPQTKTIVDGAIDAGINFIDTANVYAGGQSETLLGQSIKTKRNNLILATKFHSRIGPGPNQVGQSRVHMMEALEGSLRRLQTDYIDLYQIHSFDSLTSFDEVLRALEDAVRQGKIRYIGCSNLAAWQIMKALGISDKRNLSSFVSVQAYYSLAGRDIEHELIPMIKDQNLGLLVWSPLSGGFLSGKYNRHSEQGISRRDKIDFPPINHEKTYDIIDTLVTIGKKHNVSAAQVALAWLIAKAEVTSIIVGARNIHQLKDNVNALKVILSEEEILELNRISDTGLRYPEWIQKGDILQRLPSPNQPL